MFKHKPIGEIIFICCSFIVGVFGAAFCFLMLKTQTELLPLIFGCVSGFAAGQSFYLAWDVYKH